MLLSCIQYCSIYPFKVSFYPIVVAPGCCGSSSLSLEGVDATIEKISSVHGPYAVMFSRCET